jgi:hypothetical protein
MFCDAISITANIMSRILYVMLEMLLTLSSAENEKAPLEGMSGAFGSPAEAGDHESAVEGRDDRKLLVPLCGAPANPTNAESTGHLCSIAWEGLT